MSPFQSLRSYEKFVYTLKQRHPSIQRSTLIVIRRGRRTAVVQGEMAFAKGFRVIVKERLSMDVDQVVIESYGYEIWNRDKKIAWYDSQPHPKVPELSSTFQHHKHVLPILSIIEFQLLTCDLTGLIYRFLFGKSKHSYKWPVSSFEFVASCFEFIGSIFYPLYRR